MAAAPEGKGKGEGKGRGSAPTAEEGANVTQVEVNQHERICQSTSQARHRQTSFGSEEEKRPHSLTHSLTHSLQISLAVKE